MTKLIATLAVLSSMGVLGAQAWTVYGEQPVVKVAADVAPAWEFERVAPVAAVIAAPEKVEVEEAVEAELPPAPRGGIVLGSRSFLFAEAPKAAPRTASAAAGRPEVKKTATRPVTATSTFVDARKPLTAALSKSLYTKPSFGFSGVKVKRNTGKKVYSSR